MIPDPAIDGLRVLIVGSTAGMGLRTAEVLLARGAIVTINGRSEASAVDAQSTMGDHGERCHVVVGDAVAEGGAQRVVDLAAQSMGGLDVLVSSGASTSSPSANFFSNTDPAEYAAWANVHWLSKMALTYYALPYLDASSDAAVVYLSTDAGRFPTVGESFACGAAGALHMMTRTLALELKRNLIRVNAVATTAMRGTPGLERDLGDAEKIFEKVLAKQAFPLEPIDVAETVAYLVSRRARSVTGQILSVNGGSSTGL